MSANEADTLLGGKGSQNKWQPKGGRMRAWLADHRRVASETTLFISQRIVSSFLVWVMIGVALALPGLLWVLQSNMHSLSQQWQGSTGLTVYMALEASEQSIADMAATLQREPAVAAVKATTPQQALEELLAQSADSQFLQQAIAEVETNPLPTSFAVALDSTQPFLALETLSRQLAAQTGVDEVVIESTWLERLRDLSRLANSGGSALSAMLLVAAVLVTFAAIRLAIDSRLAELRVLALIGATRSQLRRPFLYFGSAYGLGGGIMAIVLMAVFLNEIEAPLESLLISYRNTLVLGGFTPQMVLTVLVAGWSLGVGGALIALSGRLEAQIAT
jgi:cell division transport system permease protein